MYGVDWPGEGIDYAAEAAKRNAAALGGRCDELEREIAAKDAEIARLKAALKPVIGCDIVLWDDVSNAVREAQRIYKEGEAK